MTGSANSSKLWARTAILAVIAIIAALMGGATAYAASGPPTLTSDKADYPPGGTVVLSGENWAPGESVHITVNDDAGQTWSLSSGANGAPADPVAGAAGDITYTFALPAWFVATYTATASSPTSGSVSMTFTDSAVGSFRQCKNDAGEGYPTNDCNWANGNVQGTNSAYAEGDAVPQRLELNGLVAGQTYTMQMTYSVYKDVHTYDYLATYDYSENWIDNECEGIAGCSFASPSTYPIPDDPNVPYDSGQQWTLTGGNLTGSAFVGTTASAPWTNGATNTITVTFVASASTAVLFWATHIASGADWGAGRGAASDTGADFHMYLDSIKEGSAPPTTLGQADNQMATSAIQPIGHITVIKDAVPNDAQDFTFDLIRVVTGATTPFSLDDDADLTLSNTRTFDASPGTWTISETNLPDGWSLTNLTCTGGTYTKSGATATLTVLSGQTITCTYTNTKAVYGNLTVSKTATPAFKRAYTWDVVKDVDETSVNIAEGGTATFTYTVTATPSAPVDSDWQVTGVITVANPNNVPVSGVNVTDAIGGGGSCTVTGGTNVTIPANGSSTFDYTCTYASAPTTSSVTNTATATWTAGTPYATTGSASGSATADFGAVTPQTTNGTVTVVDDKTDPAHPVTLGTATAPAAYTTTYTLTKSGVAGTCTDYTNTATVNSGATSLDFDSETVKVCVGKDLTVTKTAAGGYGARYKWLLDKTASANQTVEEGTSGNFTYSVTVTPNGRDTLGWYLGGQITVNNPNDWQAITLTSVDDVVNIGGGATCSIIQPAPYVVPKGDSLVLDYTCAISSEPNFSGLNTATVTWDEAAASTPTGTASGDAIVELNDESNPNAVIEILDAQAPGGVVGTWSYARGEHTFTYSVAYPGVAGTCTDYSNTATIGGTSTSDTATVALCVAKNPWVTKTTAGTFDRTHNWTLTKTVDQPSTQTVAAGTEVTYNYTVTAGYAGYSDSGYELHGTVTAYNPNDFQAIAATLVDAPNLGGGAVCTLDDTSVTIPAATASGPGSAQVGYTCTFASAPNTVTGSNKVTMTWNKVTYKTPASSDNATAAASYSVDTETDAQVTVTDDKTTGTPVVLGTLTAPNGDSWTYPVVKTAPEGSCMTFVNDARLDLAVRADLTDSVTSELCGQVALTASKTAYGSYDRDWNWSLTKDATATRFDIADDEVATAEYTVVATPSGPFDSNWKVEGEVTVTNPNTFGSVTVTVTDDPGIGAATCTYTYPGGGSSVEVPANQSRVVGYSCAYGAQPTAYSGTNTATVNWNGGSTTAHRSFVLGMHETDAVATITDDKTTGNGEVIGVAYAPDGEKRITYTIDLPGVGGTCTDYTNTASVDITGTPNASATVKVCVGQDLTIEKTANGSLARQYYWDITKSASQTTVNVNDDGSATWDYTVTVTPKGRSNTAADLSGLITVHNPNDWEDIPVNVTDVANQAGVSCAVVGSTNPVTVSAGETAEIRYECSIGDDPSLTGENTATATWDADTYSTPTGSASVTIPTELNLTGEVDKTVTVTDPMAPSGTFTPVTWNSTRTPTEFTYSVTRAGTPGECVDYKNVAILSTGQTGEATVTVCSYLAPVVSKTAEASFDRLYPWSITKVVDKSSVNDVAGAEHTVTYTVTATPGDPVDSGYDLHGTITITNPNTQRDMTYTVTDTTNVGAVCTIAGGASVTVDAGQTVTVDYTCTGTPSAYTGANTATVSWTAAASGTTAGSQPGTAPIDYQIASETDKTVNVVDDKTDPTTPVVLGQATWTPAKTPTEFTYSMTKPTPAGSCVTYTNTAWVEVTGIDPRDTATTTFCGGIPLTVSKTVNASMTRTYLWKITKGIVDGSAAGTAYKKFATLASTVAVPYLVVLTPTTYTDSAYAMSGTITVTNDNDWAVPVTVNELPNVGGGAVCTLGSTGSSTTTVTVPANSTLDVAYSCTFTSKPNVAYGSNVATITWNASVAHTGTVNSATTGPIKVKFAITKEINRYVNVTDAITGQSTLNFGPFDWYAGEQRIMYTRTLAVPTNGCKKYLNTATITETGQKAKATAELCGPPIIGGHTMGWWKNKNGQGLVKNAGVVSGTTQCKLSAWLAQFAPFTEVSGKTCTQLATYVMNTMTAADASGATMNAMLKAQMLATALDVYFTDPALGGVKWSAPYGPLGSVKVDITAYSAAFGGASSMTVMQMLQYASSQSNVNGTIWYNQLKATQELAKNAFDAINNNRIFLAP